MTPEPAIGAMIVEYVRYSVPADSADAFVAAYERAGASLRASKHCAGYELSRCSEDPQSFVLRIHWDSLDGHLQGFRNSPEFRSFFSEIRPYVQQIQEMRHYQPLLDWQRG